MMMWVAEDNTTVYLHNVQSKSKENDLRGVISQIKSETSCSKKNYQEEVKGSEIEGCTLNQVRFDHKKSVTKIVIQVLIPIYLLIGKIIPIRL